MHLNERLNECVQSLSDGKFLANPIAQEFKYHVTDLYNRERIHLRTIKRQQQYIGRNNQDAYLLAFSELVIYIVETKCNSEALIVFRLADMGNLYRQRLEQLGVETPDVQC